MAAQMLKFGRAHAVQWSEHGTMQPGRSRLCGASSLQLAEHGLSTAADRAMAQQEKPTSKLSQL
jgi:hypothetical protein